MKKVLFATCLLISTQVLFAQINQGQFLVGGNAGFESGKFGDVETSKYTSFELSPNAGYFFINNLAGGLRLNFSTEKFKTASNSTSAFLFAPFVRYYFLPAAQKVNIFADGSYGFGSSKSNETKSFNQYALMAGPAIFLSPNTALEFALQFSSAGGDLYGGNDRQNNFGVKVGFQVHLGNAKK